MIPATLRIVLSVAVICYFIIIFVLFEKKNVGASLYINLAGSRAMYGNYGFLPQPSD